MHNYLYIYIIYISVFTHGYDDYAIECMHAWNVFNLYVVVFKNKI